MFLGLFKAHILSLFGPHIDGESLRGPFAKMISRHIGCLSIRREINYVKLPAYRFSVYMRAK